MKTKNPISRSAFGAVLVVGSMAAIVALTVAGTGCAQLLGSSGSSATTQQNSATLMGQSLEIAAPDGSYAVQSSSSIPPTGSHVQSLMTTIVNPVAGALRESVMHLVQTVSTGQSSNNPLSYTVSSLGTSLQGTANASAGTVSYVYTVNNQPYFTGSTPTLGNSGSFNFTTNPPINVTYNIGADNLGNMVTTTTISNSSWGTLTFAATQPSSTAPPTSVTLTGTVSGTKVTGTWNSSTGGYFTDLTGAKQCFTAALQDTSGC